MDNNPKTLLEIGKIVGTHGLRGDLKVRPLSGDPDLLLNVDHTFVRLASGEVQQYEIVRQTLHKKQILLRFKGVDSINQVEQLIGCQLELPEDELPELSDDEYYWAELEGVRVVDRQRGEIGRLVSIFTTAAHDTYVVDGPYGEVMIPAVHQFVVSVDFSEGTMQVDLPDGLIQDEQ